MDNLIKSSGVYVFNSILYQRTRFWSDCTALMSSIIQMCLHFICSENNIYELPEDNPLENSANQDLFRLIQFSTECVNNRRVWFCWTGLMCSSGPAWSILLLPRWVLYGQPKDKQLTQTLLLWWLQLPGWISDCVAPWYQQVQNLINVIVHAQLRYRVEYRLELQRGVA